MKINLKKIRLGLGMTHLQVALAVGVSVNSYASWEKGVTTPSPENMKKLKKVLKIEEV